MNSDYWDTVYKSLIRSHFTGGIWFLCSVVAIIFAIKYYRKNKIYNLLLIYILYTLIFTDLIFSFLIKAFDLKGYSRTFFIETANIILAQLEIFVFSFFFMEAIYKIRFKKFTIFIQIIFFILFTILIIRILFWRIEKEELRMLSYYFNVIEFFILLGYCLFYFYHILTAPLQKITYLSTSPAFWIATGLFFYIIVSLPFLIIGDTLIINNQGLYNVGASIHYLSFGFLFICLAKAFSCKINLTI